MTNLITAKPITLLLMPFSEQGGERQTKLRDALQRAGADVRTVKEALEWGSGPQRLIPQRKVWAALQQARQVVVLPRADGSIGFGTCRDISLATDLNVPVLVVSNDGRLWPLAQAGLVLVPKAGSDRHSRQVAGHFSWPSASASRRQT